MTVKEVKLEVVRLVRNYSESESRISEETHLIKELGLTSVEIMMLIADLEDRFFVDIPDEKLRTVWTVGDLCAVVISRAETPVIWVKINNKSTPGTGFFLYQGCSVTMK